MSFPRARQRPKVLDVVRGHVEAERTFQLSKSSTKIALLASWSRTSLQSKSLSRLIAQLQQHDYSVVVCSTCPADGPLDFYADEELNLDRLNVLRRPNIGYDFGSWAVAMAHFERFLDRDYVLVLNDSLIGPFDSLSHIIEDYESGSSDVWGMTESTQWGSHLQSFFRGFRRGVLAEPRMRKFWRHIRVENTKLDIIRRYEYEFTSEVRRWCYTSEQFCSSHDVVSDNLNPMINGWRGVLDYGIPMVKRELLEKPHLVPAGHRIPEVLHSKYGIDVRDWI